MATATETNVAHITVDEKTRTEILNAADGFVQMHTTLRNRVMDLYATWRKRNWDTEKDKLNAAVTVREFFHDIDPQFPLDGTQLYARAKAAGISTIHDKKVDGKTVKVDDLKGGEIPMKTNNLQRYYPRYNFFAWIVRVAPVRNAMTTDQREAAQLAKYRGIANVVRSAKLTEQNLETLFVYIGGYERKDGDLSPAVQKMIKKVMEMAAKPIPMPRRSRNVAATQSARKSA